MPALRSFHYRDFRLLWSGQLVMSIGMWLQQIGVLWFALTLTGSPIVVSLAFGMYFFPSFFLGPFSGTIADRVDRKKLLMTVQSLDLVASLLLAVVVITGVAQVWSLLAILALSGVAKSFMMPTLQPLIFEIVGPQDVQNGISLLTVAFRIVGGLGAVAAGILIEVFGTGGAFVAATISYALGLLVISLISYQRVGGEVADTSVVANLVEGLRLFSGSTVLITLLGLSMVYEAFGFTPLALLPVFADEGVLGVGAFGLGLMNGAIGFGGMIGAIALASLGQFRSKGWLLLGSLILVGVFFVLFSQSKVFALSVIWMGGEGLVASAYHVTLFVLLLQSVPDEMRGRVIGVWGISLGAGPPFAVLLGYLAQRVGPEFAAGVSGVIVTVVVILVAVAIPQVRRIQ